MTGARLLDHWSPPDGAGAPVACLATTFTFEADFVAQDCLSRFLSLSSVTGEGDRISSIAAVLEEEDRLSEAQVSLLVDRSSPAEKRNLRWDVLPVAVPGGLLHAKVVALLWERSARLVLGSANLTSAGYRRQVELVLAWELDEGCRVPRAVLDGLVLTVDDDGQPVTWGEVAEKFQLEDAAAVLDQRPDAPRLHFLTRPRGGRKTTDLAAVAVAWLVGQAPTDGRCFVVASDEDQGRELLDAAAEFVRLTPGLGPLSVLRGSIVDESTRASVVVLAADAAGGFGRRKPHLTIVDELAQWGGTQGPRRMWTAVVSAVPKVPGGRLVILTTAGDPAHWAYKVLESARTRPELWRVRELPGPLPWRTEQELEAQRALLLPSEYAQLHENVWTAGEDRLVSAEELARCVTLTGPLEPRAGRSYVIALDLSRTTDNTVASVCHAEDIDGVHRRVVLDLQQVWTPSKARALDQAQVEEWCAWASSWYLGAPVVMDAYDASGLAQALHRRGVSAQMVPFTAQSVGRLANRLHALLRHGLLALPDDPALLDELANVRLRQTSPGLFRMDHDAGRHDDRAVSLALAAEHLLQYDVPAARAVVVDRFGRLLNVPDDSSSDLERFLWKLHAERERAWSSIEFGGEEPANPLTMEF